MQQGIVHEVVPKSLRTLAIGATGGNVVGMNVGALTLPEDRTEWRGGGSR